jgi:activator of HSP90 ATPase
MKQIKNMDNMAIEFEVSGVINASQKELYEAWLNSEKHTAMTGGEALVSDVEGESFEAWDGYIEGMNVELQPHSRILQKWRTSEFSESEDDSMLEITFAPEGAFTLVSIHHYNLPEHGWQYKQGWVDNYFNPMQDYFGG